MPESSPVSGHNKYHVCYKHSAVIDKCPPEYASLKRSLAHSPAVHSSCISCDYYDHRWSFRKCEFICSPFNLYCPLPGRGHATPWCTLGVPASLRPAVQLSATLCLSLLFLLPLHLLSSPLNSMVHLLVEQWKREWRYCGHIWTTDRPAA